MPDQNEGSGFDKFFISCSHASGTPCNVKKKTINTASYAAGSLMRLSTVSDTSTKAMCRDLCHMAAILPRKLFHLDQPSSNTKKHLLQQARPDVEMSEACKGKGDILDAGEVYSLRSHNQAEPAAVKQIHQRGRPRWWRGDWRQCSKGSQGDPKQKRQALKKRLASLQ